MQGANPYPVYKTKETKMCNFLSAIVMRNGDILCDPQFTDSHEDLLDKHNIRDGLVQQDKFARVEFIPPNDASTLLDLDTWALKVDEKSPPSWLDKGKVRASLAARVKRMFITDERKILLGGCWILGGDAKVAKVKNARIYAMLDSSTVEFMYGHSKVERMYNSSKVEYMYDYSKVGGMWGSSKVERMLDSSEVGHMCGSSKVGDMRGASKVDYMSNSSKVLCMYGSSKVRVMYGYSKVENMRDYSKVERMFDSSKIVYMCHYAKVGNMYESSVIPESKSPVKDCR